MRTWTMCIFTRKNPKKIKRKKKKRQPANCFVEFYMKGIPSLPPPSVVKNIDLPFQAAKWNQNVQSWNLSGTEM